MVLKRKVGVLIEEHFDPTEYVKFNEYFPAHGYEVIYISHLWGQPSLTFGSNPENDKIQIHAEVSHEVNEIDPTDYNGFICIGGYAMDRLRYQQAVQPRKNNAPAVTFIRNAIQFKTIKIGAICHGLWLLCATPNLLKQRKVTCAHNIICDVENAGAIVMFENDKAANVVVDGNLITGSHPDILQQFMDIFKQEMDNEQASKPKV